MHRPLGEPPTPAIIPPPPDPPPTLDYAGREPLHGPKWRAVWRNIVELGPIFPRPSWVTLGLLLACAFAAWFLHHAPEPWRHVRSAWVGQTNGTYPNTLYLRSMDAIVSPNAENGLRVWRPWTNETLLNAEAPPATLPPNPPPGRRGEIWWITASADESRLLARSSEMGDYLWDARNGRLVAELATYLGPEAAKRPYFCLGALSPDGSRLCIVNDAHELLLYDVTGPRGVLLARRQLQPLPDPAAAAWEQGTFDVRFTPDGKHVIVLGKAGIWVGDAGTLRERLLIPSVYCLPGDVAVLKGGRQMLVVVRAVGNDEARVYDLASAQVLRRWPLPAEPSTVSVSPDERRAVVGLRYDAARLLDLADMTEGGGSRAAPAHLAWYGTPLPFFPDNRRALAIGELWGGEPGIVDTETGRHVAKFYPPRRGWLGPRAYVSPDGRHVGFVGSNQLHVYEQVGRESAWGVMATWQFWLLALCVGALVVSLCRDAASARRRWGRSASLPRPRAALAALLVTAGGVAIQVMLVWLAIECRTWWGGLYLFNATSRAWFDGGWAATLFAFYLLAGIGLLTGSRGWTLATAITFAATVGIAVWLMWTAEYGRLPATIFDRDWMLRPRWMTAAQVAWAALAIVGMAALLPRGSRAARAT